jgi:predicted amidophosphoribosyltransferase
VIRFPCPVCNKMLKVPDNKGGKPVLCPRCQEPSVARAESVPYLEQARPEPTPQSGARMSHWLRGAIVMVAALGLISLSLALLAPLLPLSADSVAVTRFHARFVVPTCLVLVLLLVYADATSCPACGKWWARMEGETTSLRREVLEQGRVRRMRATREMTYICKYCRHTWSATYTDEYEAARPRRGKPT